MFFALGFLVAGLLGLMILPALWRRAVRLSTRRLEMQVPLSMEEVLADRDLLRAEFAVERRRLEMRMGEIEDARTRDRAELGRMFGALTRETDALAATRADLAKTEDELAARGAELVDARAQLGAALVEAFDGISAREKYDALSLDAQRLRKLTDERKVAIATLEARLAGFEAQARDLQRALTERENFVKARETVLDRVTEERDRARAEVAHYSQSHAALRSQIEARDRRIAELDDAQAELARKVAAAERRAQGMGLGVSVGPAADDAGLRRSIEDLGSEVLRIARALEAPQEEKKPAKKRAGKGARASVN